MTLKQLNFLTAGVFKVQWSAPFGTSYELFLKLNKFLTICKSIFVIPLYEYNCLLYNSSHQKKLTWQPLNNVSVWYFENLIRGVIWYIYTGTYIATEYKQIIQQIFKEAAKKRGTTLTIQSTTYRPLLFPDKKEWITNSSA